MQDLWCLQQKGVAEPSGTKVGWMQKADHSMNCIVWELHMGGNDLISDLLGYPTQGLWWQPTASSMKAQPSALAQSLADAEGGAELLKLAAAQRMNTETRRAVFCIVMGSQDAVDASERLLRLPLKVAHTQMSLMRFPVDLGAHDCPWAVFC